MEKYFYFSGIQLFSLVICTTAYLQASYGNECNQTRKCDTNDFLACSGGKCKCLLPLEMEYDYLEDKCVASPGERCDYFPVHPDTKTKMNTLISCGSTAACIQGVCKCRSQYLGMGMGFCTLKPNVPRFGQTCSSKAKCDPSVLHLVCGNNGHCICDPETSLYNATRNDCVGLVGSHCGSDVGCIKNAACISGQCLCKSDSYKTTHKTCERKKRHGDTCDFEMKCLERHGLQCNTNYGVCECASDMVVHPETKTCVKAAGTNCNITRPNLQCVPFASCVNFKGFSGNRINSDDFRCTCKHGYKDVNGYCYVPEGHSCDNDVNGEQNDRPCIPGLLCRNGTCSCPYKDHQVYDKSTLSSSPTCRSLVDGPCGYSPDCIENAECVNEYGVSTCRCKHGFVPTNRMCDLAYGENCTNYNASTVCDRLAPLECGSQGTCECSDFQMYDQEALRCRGLVGAKCGVTDKDSCVDGAICKAFRGRDAKTGVCVCKLGLFAQTDRTCNETLPIPDVMAAAVLV